MAFLSLHGEGRRYWKELLFGSTSGNVLAYWCLECTSMKYGFCTKGALCRRRMNGNGTMWTAGGERKKQLLIYDLVWIGASGSGP